MSRPPPPIDAEFITKARAAMKACQVGVGGRDALEKAHLIMADCYGIIGRFIANHEHRDGLKLEPEVLAALDQFSAEQTPPLSRARAAHAIIRDALIGLGILPLPDSNRARGARRGR